MVAPSPESQSRPHATKCKCTMRGHDDTKRKGFLVSEPQDGTFSPARTEHVAAPALRSCVLFRAAFTIEMHAPR
eukprot:4886654-Prymnesium_polylepis.2